MIRVNEGAGRAAVDGRGGTETRRHEEVAVVVGGGVKVHAAHDLTVNCSAGGDAGLLVLSRRTRSRGAHGQK